MLGKEFALAIKNITLVNPKKNMPTHIKKMSARTNSGSDFCFNFTG